MYNFSLNFEKDRNLRDLGILISIILLSGFSWMSYEAITVISSPRMHNKILGPGIASFYNKSRVIMYPELLLILIGIILTITFIFHLYHNCPHNAKFISIPHIIIDLGFLSALLLPLIIMPSLGLSMTSFQIWLAGIGGIVFDFVWGFICMALGLTFGI